MVEIVVVMTGSQARFELANLIWPKGLVMSIVQVLRFAVHVTSMASQSSNTRRHGSKICTVRSIVTSIYRTLDWHGTTRVS